MKIAAFAAFVLLAPSLAAAFPPDGPETDSTRCVTTITDFLGLTPGSSHKIKGGTGGTSCSGIVEYERYQSGISRRMDRRIMLDADVGYPGRHPFSFLGDREELASQAVYNCSVEGDALELDYSWSEKMGWRKSYRIRARLERSAGRLVFIRLSKKEERFLGGGWDQKAECRATPEAR